MLSAVATDSNGSINTSYPAFITVLAPASLQFQQNGGQLQLAWPVAAGNYHVDCATNLATPVPWMPLTNTIQQTNGFFVIPVDFSQPQKYFGLRGPSERRERGIHPYYHPPKAKLGPIIKATLERAFPGQAVSPGLGHVKPFVETPAKPISVRIHKTEWAHIRLQCQPIAQIGGGQNGVPGPRDTLQFKPDPAIG